MRINKTLATPGFVLLITLILTSLVMGQSTKQIRSWSEYAELRSSGALGAPRAPAHVQPNLRAGKIGSFVTFATRDLFKAEYDDRTLEDYSSPLVQDSTKIECLDAVSSTSDGPCYPSDELQPGITHSYVQSPSSSLVSVGDNFAGNSSTALGPNIWVDDLVINFEPPVGAVALDVADFAGVGSFDVIVIDGLGASMSTSFSPGVGIPVFFGVASSDLVAAIIINDDAYGGAAELVDDLETAETPAFPSLLFPANGATGIPLTTGLVWSSVPNATRYNVQVATDAAFNNLVHTADTSNTQAQFKTDQAATTFWWRVQSVDSTGTTSVYSPAFRLTTLVLPTTAPVLLAPVDGLVDVPLSINLAWEPATNAVGYNVQVATDESFANLVFGRNTPGTTVSFATDLQGVTFWWRVQSVDAGGIAPAPSAAFSFTTHYLPPPAPTLASPAHGSDGVATQAELYWVEITGVTAYHVQVSTSSDMSSIHVEDSTLTGSPFATQIPYANSAVYFWRVRANNLAGWGPWSTVRAFTTAPSVSSETSDIPEEYSLAQNYPNPLRTTTAISYRIPETVRVRLTLMDALGRLVLTLTDDIRTPGTYTVVWDASEMVSGPYFYRLEAGPFTATKTMLLAR